MKRNRNNFFFIFWHWHLVYIFLCLIMDLQPFCPKELNIFITWNSTKVGNRSIENLGDELLVILSEVLWATSSSIKVREFYEQLKYYWHLQKKCAPWDQSDTWLATLPAIVLVWGVGLYQPAHVRDTQILTRSSERADWSGGASRVVFRRRACLNLGRGTDRLHWDSESSNVTLNVGIVVKEGNLGTHTNPHRHTYTLIRAPTHKQGVLGRS